jgi:hypothetical protein
VGSGARECGDAAISVDDRNVGHLARYGNRNAWEVAEDRLRGGQEVIQALSAGVSADERERRGVIAKAKVTRLLLPTKCIATLPPLNFNRGRDISEPLPSRSSASAGSKSSMSFPCSLPRS